MPATDKNFYNLKKMHIVFAFSSLALFAVTIWMMGADHSRGWPDYQRKFEDIEARKLHILQAPFKADEHTDEVVRIEGEIKQAKAVVSGKEAEIGGLRKALKDAEFAFDLAERAVKTQRQFRGVASANYDLGIRDNLPQAKLDSLHALFQQENGKVAERELDLQNKEAARDAAKTELEEQIAATGLTAAEEALKKLQSDNEQLHTALAKIDPPGFSGVKRSLMEWYIVDGFNSHLKITNDWLPDLKIKLGMAKTARFDRCRTCHQGIDRTDGFDDFGNTISSFPHGATKSDDFKDWVAENIYPHPYSTHPNPDLFVTASSPHPSTEGSIKFGCTICHEGQGSGTEFSNSAHYPNNPHQHEEWEEHYGFQTNHYWEYPMYPKRYAESACIKCHHRMEELGNHPKFGASAPKVFKGYKLIERYGCFGCHEIQGYESGKPIGPDLRLEPNTASEAIRIAADPNLIAGRMRKVGPALRHIKAKTNREWIEYWTEDPSKFRPTTKMPKFFHLTNQHDDLAAEMQPVEIAGITQYLLDNSQQIDLLSPESDYRADAERGKEAFSKRGCLACHTHKEFPAGKNDFGPELSRVAKKINPNADGAKWLYTWILEPERHHARTKMPNLYINSDEKDGIKRDAQGKVVVDPAADIVAFLLRNDASDQLPEFTGEAIKVNESSLQKMVDLFLSKALTESDRDNFYQSHKYPVPANVIKGDEAELTKGSNDGAAASDEEWNRMRLNYVGRRTISRYGCYGCHDIPGFEKARSIGTTLQDWGRKDTSKLALEHIEEFLHHHGEADGSSTKERAEDALKRARAHEFSTPELEESENRLAYAYESLLHHGRAGFLFQKLRQPRSYDYKKTETKRYDERLLMPKFPISEEDIEAISTFVLGLVAEPPAPQYIYQPDEVGIARVEGERILRKYNCAGCHVIELPEVTYAADPNLFSFYNPAEEKDQASFDLLMQLKPAREAMTGKKTADGKPIIRFRGLKVSDADPEEDEEFQLYTYNSWENLTLDGKLLTPLSKHSFTKEQLVNLHAGRGGDFSRLLLQQELGDVVLDPQKRSLAWQASPPPLYLQGLKTQTPWLYRFLKEPARLRHTTVLRMPQFNMSDEEARILANYFSAVDGVPFPYQEIPERDPDYLPKEIRDNPAAYPQIATNDKYLSESWKLLNHPKACINCHTVGGNAVKIADPKKDIRGPNLDLTTNRLRPDWVMLWLYKPSWITPYTSMPGLFNPGSAMFNSNNDPNYSFGGRDGVPPVEAVGSRDALMNYHRLLEQHGILKIPGPKAPEN